MRQEAGAVLPENTASHLGLDLVWEDHDSQLF